MGVDRYRMSSAESDTGSHDIDLQYDSLGAHAASGGVPPPIPTSGKAPAGGSGHPREPSPSDAGVSGRGSRNGDRRSKRSSVPPNSPGGSSDDSEGNASDFDSQRRPRARAREAVSREGRSTTPKRREGDSMTLAKFPSTSAGYNDWWSSTIDAIVG